ncbi:MAG TPA: hypothetical protein VGW75_16315 [Solirubrobacteraceae bacterium]|nr:hypothetical protein [Solirubrobacteraceae bacterium]
MNRTGRGRPPAALALAVLALLAAAPAAPAASGYGNVVDVALPRPAADEVVLARLQAAMTLRPGRRGGLGSLAVRRAGGRLPRGFALAAVRARPRGATVTVWLAAVRTRAARGGRPLRVRLRIGGARVAYRRATTWSVGVRPGRRVRGVPGCGTISGEAERWTAVGGLRSIALGGQRFAARTAAGAALEVACRRSIRSLSPLAAERFLNAVDARFAGTGEAVEGFFATWARDAAGNAVACVFVRGARGGGGDVTIAGATRRFALDAEHGVARVDAALPGPGDHPFLVRWRQRDGTVRESESTLRVPAGGTRGDGPPPPYSAAGSCP